MDHPGGGWTANPIFREATHTAAAMLLLLITYPLSVPEVISSVTRTIFFLSGTSHQS